jgi:hypothetical protein
MDLNIRLINVQDLLKATQKGKLDFETRKQLLLKLALENAAPCQYDILIDNRQATGTISITEITELVEVMIEHRESFRSKIALLAPPETTLELAKFLELYTCNRGFQVRTFRDFEEAINWLMTSTELFTSP